MSTNQQLVYLASPYTHNDESVVEKRIEIYCKVDAVLTHNGIFTAPPLLKHFIIQHRKLPSDWEYWKHYSQALLSRCDSMIVLCLNGWLESVGVLEEIRYCDDHKIPVTYIDLPEIEEMIKTGIYKQRNPS